MRTSICLLFCVASFLLVSCSEDTILNGRPPYDGFLFHIDVSGPGRVSDLRVSTWSKLSIPSSTPDLPPDGNATGMPCFSTAVTFLSPVACLIDLTVFDLENKPVDTLVDNYVLAGETSTEWSGPSENTPGGVYKCIASAYDPDGGTLIYRDSIWMVMWQPDPEITVIGYTGSDGSFETSDSLLFPSTFKPPRIPRTGEQDDTVIDSFTVLDTIVIALTDTVTNKLRTFTRKITNGRNFFELEWEPLSPQPTDRISAGDMPVMVNTKPHDPQPPTPTEFELRQNYPNPFN